VVEKDMPGLSTFIIFYSLCATVVAFYCTPRLQIHIQIVSKFVVRTMDLLKRIQRFDAYPKTVEDFRIRTTTGAASKLHNES